LTQIAGGPLGNFAQQAQGESWGWVETHMLHIQYTNEEYIYISNSYIHFVTHMITYIHIW
jgi:hypothetical protein